MTLSPNASSPIERYCHDLTQLVRQDAFPPASASYEAVCQRVFQILTRRNKCCPMLLDLDGTTRWSALAEVVRRIAAEEVPETLRVRRVIMLDYEVLFTNPTPYQYQPPPPEILSEEEEREWELAQALSDAGSHDLLDQLWWNKYGSRPLWPRLEEWSAPDAIRNQLKELFLAIKQEEGRVLLFVDNVHWLLGWGESPYSIDTCDLLKPTLARREIELIGACTLDQYLQYVNRDACVQRRFQEVLLKTDEEL